MSAGSSAGAFSCSRDPLVPEDWPPGVARWAAELLESRRVSYATVTPAVGALPELGPELTDQQAMRFWLPLDAVLLDDDEGQPYLQARSDAAGAGSLSTFLAWPDGSLHMGPAPQRPADFLALYRCARLTLEQQWALGQRDALSVDDTASPTSTNLGAIDV